MNSEQPLGVTNSLNKSSSCFTKGQKRLWQKYCIFNGIFNSIFNLEFSTCQCDCSSAVNYAKNRLAIHFCLQWAQLILHDNWSAQQDGTMPAVTQTTVIKNEQPKEPKPRSQHTSCTHFHLDLQGQQWGSAGSLWNVKCIGCKHPEECQHRTENKRKVLKKNQLYRLLHTVVFSHLLRHFDRSPLTGRNKNSVQNKAIQVLEGEVLGGSWRTVGQQ